MVAGEKDLAQIIPNPFLIINITYSQCGKTDDRIHWCTDIVRHIRKESTLRLVCCLCRTYCLRKCLIHFPVIGTVRHNQDIFLFPVYFTLQYYGTSVFPLFSDEYIPNPIPSAHEPGSPPDNFSPSLWNSRDPVSQGHKYPSGSVQP